jgi:predicted MFS family arabinose efflux permease
MPTTRRAKLRARLGVRGYSLLLCAFVWALVGYGVATAGTPGNSPGTFHDELPEPVRLIMWLGAAAVALVLAWLPRLDWIALALLIIGPVVRCCSYLTSWVLYMTGHPGLRDGWYAAAIYVALIGIVGIAAVSHRQPYLVASESA